MQYRRFRLAAQPATPRPGPIRGPLEPLGLVTFGELDEWSDVIAGLLSTSMTNSYPFMGERTYFADCRNRARPWSSVGPLREFTVAGPVRQNNLGKRPLGEEAAAASHRGMPVRRKWSGLLPA
jgi:hypothetical protein